MLKKNPNTAIAVNSHWWAGAKKNMVRLAISKRKYKEIAVASQPNIARFCSIPDSFAIILKKHSDSKKNIDKANDNRSKEMNTGGHYPSFIESKDRLLVMINK